MRDRPRAFSLDNNIYDKLAADADAAQALTVALNRGALEPLLKTYVLEDELPRAPAETRALAAQLRHRRIEVHGTTLGIWRLDESKFADEETFDAIRGNTTIENLRHARDALHLSTARAEGAVFVTEDARLISTGKRLGVLVWSWSRFRDYILHGLTVG